MSVSPKVAVAIHAGAAVLSGIVALGVNAVPSYVPHGIAVGIVQTAAYVGFISNSVAAVLAGYSSAAPGPLVSLPAAAPAPETK